MDFELDGQKFVALNGGPEFTFSEAVSFMIDCKDQDEVDHYWTALGQGGEPGPCGWLKDRFGLSWQVIPTRMNDCWPTRSGAREPRHAGDAHDGQAHRGRLKKAADG